MSVTSQSSLLEPSGSPVMGGAVVWVGSTLFGGVAAALCVLAVAWIGFAMLSGRFPLRDGLRVVLGCFLLLGAPAIAAVFLGVMGEPNRPAPIAPPPEDLGPREELKPSRFDPYSGA